MPSPEGMRSAFPQLVIVGLGPGTSEHLTTAAVHALQSLPVLLRTRHHPVATSFPGSEQWQDCDDLYETARSFKEVYDRIVQRVLELAKEQTVAYAVPGHPLVGETTVRRLLQEAPQYGIGILLIPGLSFVDVVLPILGIDALVEHLQLVDALELVACQEGIPFTAGRWPLSPLRPALLGQIYDRVVASSVKLALERLYPANHPLTIVSGAGTSVSTIQHLSLYQLDHVNFDSTTAVYIPPVHELEGRVTEALQRIVARLRAPGGCPWDREQTHSSLRQHLIEEAYEVLDALDTSDDESFCEELGDLLLQVIMHAQLAEERGAFTYEDIVGAVTEKLIRRHPHVFGEAAAESASAVLARWEELKAREQAQRKKQGTLVPSSLPALARTQRLLEHLRRRDPTRFQALRQSLQVSSTALDGPSKLLRTLILLAAEACEENIDIESALRSWTLEFEQSLMAKDE